MSPSKLSAALLLIAFAAAPTRAQSPTWMTDLGIANDSIDYLDTSPSGYVAVGYEVFLGSYGFTILDPLGNLHSEFGLFPVNSPSAFDLTDAIFRDDDVLVVCGEESAGAYMGAFDIHTGLQLWSAALTGDARLTDLTTNDLGHIIGLGNIFVPGAQDYYPILCAVDPLLGGFKWFRQYSPGTGSINQECVVSRADGDLYVVMNGGGLGVVLMRLTNFGHERWSKILSVPGSSLSSFHADVTPDGALLLSFLASDGESVNAAARIEDDGTLGWAYEYEALSLQGSGSLPRSRPPVATADGGMFMGFRALDPGSNKVAAAVMRLRPDGTPLWARTYGDPTATTLDAAFLAPSSEGGFVGMHASSGARVFRAGAGGDVGPCTGLHTPISHQSLQLTIQPFAYTYQAYPGAIAPDPVVLAGFQPTTQTPVCGLPCAPASSYCNAKVNSAGCAPQIDSTGTASLTGTGITVTASQVLNNKSGLLFWGRNPAGSSFQGGLKCVASPTVRTPIQDAAGSSAGNDCTGTYAFTFDPAYMASKGITAGDVIHCQYWSRDPQMGSTTGLTDARQFTVCP